MRVSATLASISLAILVMAGCSKPPVEQIEAAEKAVKEAQQTGASTYTAAQGSLRPISAQRWAFISKLSCR